MLEFFGNQPISINTSELLKEVELAVRFNYDSGSLVDQAMQLAAPPTETAATTASQKIAIATAREGLEVLSDTEEYIHRTATQTAAAQYLTLESTQDPQQLPQQLDPQSQEALLAMEMLLANNGSLFNGAVGGLPLAPETANTIATERAERANRRRAERKRNQVPGIPRVERDLDQEADEEDQHHKQEQYEAIFQPEEDAQLSEELAIGAYASLNAPRQSGSSRTA